MSRAWWVAARLLSGAAILAVLVWRLGGGPFVQGIRMIDGWSLAAAAGITIVTTVSAAWRWRLVARGLGVAVPLRTAIAAYYRSQFLNMTVPGGIVGDVHRGLVHGRAVGDVGRALRAVAWERAAGQVVQAALTIVVLIVLPSPVRAALPATVGVAVLLGLVVLILLRVSPTHGPSRWSRAVRAANSDILDGVLARSRWPGIVVASVVVVAGHTTIFLIAARTAGVTASPTRMLPLALLVLLAMGIPANIGGWGPREGMAAWAFGAAGLGVDQGVAAAVVYGVMALIATLPGAVVLVAARRHRGPSHRGPEQPDPQHPDLQHQDPQRQDPQHPDPPDPDRINAVRRSAPVAAGREGLARG